jgi:hypothetical protein
MLFFGHHIKQAMALEVSFRPSSDLPQCTDWDCLEAIAKACHALSIVQHHAGDKAIARSLLKFSQSPEILCRHGRSRLDLDSDHFANAALKNNVDFGAILVTEVIKRGRRVAPARLPSKFLEYKSFQKLTQHGAVLGQDAGIQPEQRGGQSGVCEMQLGRLDETTQAVTVLWSQVLQQEYPLQQGHVVADGRPAQLERGGHFRHIDQQRGLPGGKLKEPWQRLQDA